MKIQNFAIEAWLFVICTDGCCYLTQGVPISDGCVYKYTNIKYTWSNPRYVILNPCVIPSNK